METALVLAMLATLSKAGIIPILPALDARDGLHNSTINATAGQNSTQVDPGSALDYSTAAWRVYIAFLVLGILMAVVMLPVVCSADILHWYRAVRTKKKVEQRKIEIEFATAKMREMKQQPEGAHLRPERFG